MRMHMQLHTQKSQRNKKTLEIVTYPFVFHKPISILMDFSLLFVTINFILYNHS